jgi:diguanylate cyclase (GGDEF)-like protein
MKRNLISFREFLERVAPLAELPPTDRERARAALATGDAERIERAALALLERMVGLGLYVRTAETREGPDRLLRFERANADESLVLRLAAPRLAEGIVAIPRGLLRFTGSAPLERMHRLRELGDTLLGGEGRLPSGPAELVAEILEAAKELLDCEEAAFFPHTRPSAGPVAYAPPPGEVEWLAAAVLTASRHGKFLVSCPDVHAAPTIAHAGHLAGMRAVAAASITAERAGLTGTLEVRSALPGHFTSERLSLLMMLAEHYGALADRAAQLQRLVFVDALTGVANSAFFRQALDNEVARAQREGKSMALVIGDIDDFKRFNTEFGYEGGNAVLRGVAQEIKHTLRPFDTVARWGGEEFAMLLTSPVTREDAETVAERLRAAVAEAQHTVVDLDGHTSRAQVTVSLGGALYPDDAHSAQDLWRRANQALLLAKSPPKNRVVFWTADTGDAPVG